MKKLIICTALLVTGMLSSCSNDPNKEYCFEVGYTISYRGGAKGGSNYIWCTEERMRAELELIKEDLIASGVPEEQISVSGKRVYNISKATCSKFQPSDETE